MKRLPTPEEIKSVDRIRQLVEERCDGSQQVFADKVGIGKSSVSQYMNGKNFPSNIRAAEIAKAFNVHPMWVMGFDVPMTDQKNIFSYPDIYPIEKHCFPVLGSVACGEPIFMSEEKELYVEAGAGINADFVLHCKGDSMIGARIHDGDIVFVRSQPVVDNGEIAVVAIDDESTLKRFYKYGDLIVLRAENPDFPDIEIRPEDGKEIHILGRAVAFQSDVK